MRASLSLVLFFAALPVAAAEPTSIEQIRQAIRAEGLSWTAGETSVSRLTPEQLQARLIPAAEHAAHLAEAARGPFKAPPDPPAGGLPSYLDWRDRDGFCYATPVRNQGNCGSCWAFGTLSAVEALYIWRSGQPFTGASDFDLSEQDLIDCSDSGGCNGGNTFGNLPRYIADPGVSFESCYEYEAADGVCRAGNCPDRFRIDSHTVAAPLGPFGPEDVNTINTIKLELYRRPLATSMAVYSDFQSYHSGVYEKTEGATLSGYHAVALMGWDDENQAFLVKNSWGPDWGMGGFFWVKYWGSGIGAATMRFEYLEDLGPQCGELPESIELDAGHPERNRIFDIANTGGDLLSWEASTDVGWIKLTPARGHSMPGATAQLDVRPLHPPAEGGSATITLTLEDGTSETIAVTLKAASDVEADEVSDGGCSAGGSGPPTAALLLLALALALALRRR